MSGAAGGGSKGTAAAVAIPGSAKKLVQSLKEIVNCPEAEIYAMLKECGMDPDEAVNRLLSQDTFHEVKSKREKKKEMKEIPESRPRAVNNSSSRGSRIGVDRGGRSSSTQFSSADYGLSRGKPANKKENETSPLPTSSVVGPSMTGYNLSRKSTGLSAPASTESTVQAIGLDDGISSSSQPSSGFQNNWMGKPGQVSMADIVKMGRPQGKPSSSSFVPSDTPCTMHNGVMPSMSQYSAGWSTTTIPPSEPDVEFHSSQDRVSEDAEIGHELGTGVGHCIPHSDWSLVEESAICGSLVPETSGAFASYADPSTSSTLHVDEADLQLNHLDEIRGLEGNITGESLPSQQTRSAPATDIHIQIDNVEDDFQADDDPMHSISSYQPQRHAFEHEEVENVDEEISSAAGKLQQLRLHKEELAVSSAGDNPAVIIPSHLQVTNADCSHLSFGSFGSGINATFSGSYPSKPLQSNLEMSPVVDDAASLEQSDARNLDYYDDGQLQYTSNENVASDTVTNTRNYDIPSAPQPEIIRNDTLDAAHGLQYNLPSGSGYAFPITTQANTAVYTYPQANQQIQNLSPFSSLLQPYNNSLPSSLMAPNVPPFREFDLPFSPLLSTQTMPTKYSTSMSTVTGPTTSMPEAKPGVFSAPQQSSQTLPSTSIPTGPGLPQHLPIHPYSQPTLPLGHFANMIGYPFMPQSYAYLPSAAFQQPYAGNGPFHQSPTALHNAGMKYTLPQYKSSLSMTSLPQPSAVVSGYGGFGSSANIAGNFSLNPSTAAASTTMGFDEALSLQYKEGGHYVPQQQTENSMWVQGAGSRTASALPSSSFYSFQGQSQPGVYRQGQQPSHYGAAGYHNMYHSQAGASQEHQNPNEGSLNGSQGLQSQQSHQIWQHGY